MSLPQQRRILATGVVLLIASFSNIKLAQDGLPSFVPNKNGNILAVPSTNLSDISAYEDHGYKLQPTTTTARRTLSNNCFKANTNILNVNSLLPNETLPYPLIHLGFPKTGTSSLNLFFRNQGVKSRHYTCGRNNYIGTCMQKALRDARPPLQSCSGKGGEPGVAVAVWAQMDFTGFHGTKKKNINCFWPQIDALDAIHEESPNATFILNFRDIDNWISSLRRWGTLGDRLSNCSFFPGEQTDDNFKRFFCDHVKRVRSFVAKRPSHALVELDIEDEHAGERLASLFSGVNESYWMQRNKNDNSTKLGKRSKKNKKKL